MPHHTHPFLWSIFILFFITLISITIWDIYQKEHAILRNYPLIGHFRYILEKLGVYFRPLLYARDTEELPFNRVTRTWAYEAAKNKDTTIGFGTTRDLHSVGTIYFVDAPYPLLNRDAVATKPITIGPNSRSPYTARTLVNISAMSYGSISENAILALAQGAKLAGCWLNTGEGGISNFHLESGCDLVAQIGTAKYGYRDEKGHLSESHLKEAANYSQIKMFEIKLSQGAKPGQGGLLPAIKVTPEIAQLRGITPYHDAVSPNRFPEISNNAELLDFIHRVREITGKPTGFKVALGSYDWLDELCQEIHKRGVEHAPDFITLDGAEGGTGAAPATLAGFMGLPITESLPTLVDILTEYDLRERIKIIAAGKLVTPNMVAWALAVGADFVNSARGFLLALGCIQALRCHNNTCPTGITTHNPRLMRGLDPQHKSVRVANYVKTLEHEVGMLCHSCGVHEPRELTRQHVRIVSENGTSVSVEEIYPTRVRGVKLKEFKKFTGSN